MNQNRARSIEGVVGKWWAKTFAIHLPLLSAQHSSKAHQAQIHTGDAGQFYTWVGVSSSDFGAECGKWCALLEPGFGHASICPDQCAYDTNNSRI